MFRINLLKAQNQSELAEFTWKRIIAKDGDNFKYQATHTHQHQYTHSHSNNNNHNNNNNNNPNNDGLVGTFENQNADCESLKVFYTKSLA